MIMLYRFRRELDYFLKESTETDLDRHRDTLFVHSCGLRKREKIYEWRDCGLKPPEMEPGINHVSDTYFNEEPPRTFLTSIGVYQAV